MSEEPTLSKRICLQILGIVSIGSLSHVSDTNRDTIVLAGYPIHFLVAFSVLKMPGVLFQSPC